VTDQPQPSPKEDETSETTQLLRAWAGGDRDALERLTPRVYRTLRRIAGHHLRNERPGNTLQATALVHEAYLELIDITNVDWQHRAHFFAVSAQIMRHILLDRARRRVAAKRGGNAERVDLDELPDLSGERANELIAAVLEISPETVMRDWKFARSWLQAELSRR
jgi:RNA polymerase sigma factor (TIGR02999 family)